LPAARGRRGANAANLHAGHSVTFRPCKPFAKQSAGPAGTKFSRTCAGLRVFAVWATAPLIPANDPSIAPSALTVGSSAAFIISPKAGAAVGHSISQGVDGRCQLYGPGEKYVPISFPADAFGLDGFASPPPCPVRVFKHEAHSSPTSCEQKRKKDPLPRPSCTVAPAQRIVAPHKPTCITGLSKDQPPSVPRCHVRFYRAKRWVACLDDRAAIEQSPDEEVRES